MGRLIKIRPVETGIVKDQDSGRTIGRKPRKPSKPSEPKKPTKTSLVKKRIDLYGGESLASLIRKLPKGTALDEVFVRSDYGRYDDYHSTYVEYNGIYELSDTAYEHALEQHKKKLRNYENRLLEWEARMQEYNKLLPEWEAVEAAYEVKKLQHELDKAEELLAKRLKKNYVLPEETKVKELKQKLAKAKSKK